MDVSVKQIPSNILIMLPSLLLIFYLLSMIIPLIYLSMFIFISILPFIKHFSPTYVSKRFYPAAIIISALLFLNSALVEFNVIHRYPILSSLVIPLNITTAITFDLGLGVLFIVEGLLAKRVHVALGFLFLSLATFLDQLAIFRTMEYSGIPYIYAALKIYLDEGIAIITLITSGYQTTLPLANMHFSIDFYMFLAFLVSAIGSVSYFLVVKDEDRSARLNELALAVITGSLIGFVIFVTVNEFSRYGLQIFVVAVAITAIILLIRSSTRKLDVLIRNKEKT